MRKYDFIIIGAGFTGLSAAYYLTKLGKKTLVLEKNSSPGGLASSFRFNDGVSVEKFYHHWFNSDNDIRGLLKELGVENDIIVKNSSTGMYLNGRIWKLSSPIDLMKFKELSFIDRIRLGSVVIRVKLLKNWKKIDHLSIREWLEPICGKNVYDVVWQPLISAKFSIFAEKISAVWMWKKLALRGGTRNKEGSEQLSYFKGGFGRLAEILVMNIRSQGGEVLFNQDVENINFQGKKIQSVLVNKKNITGINFLFTTALTITASLFKSTRYQTWLESLVKIEYLGNICLILRLKKSLSDTYWINVNEPNFPFVGVIEHTNFDSPENYAGSHIVYLSKYIPSSAKEYSFSNKKYLEYALPYIQKMFPSFSKDWLIDYVVWREKFAQPVTVKNYSNIIPQNKTPYENGFISTMAQIYPEDRGTNYAIREGKKIANYMINKPL